MQLFASAVLVPMTELLVVSVNVTEPVGYTPALSQLGVMVRFSRIFPEPMELAVDVSVTEVEALETLKLMGPAVLRL